MDRLIDLEPKNSRELPFTRAQSLRELKAKRDIWIDCAGAVADQEAKVMGFAGLAGFDDQAALRPASALANEIVMHGAGGQ